MPKRVTTHDGDVLDELVWQHYGRSDVLSAVLEANPHLAQWPPVLSAGLARIFHIGGRRNSRKARYYWCSRQF